MSQPPSPTRFDKRVVAFVVLLGAIGGLLYVLRRGSNSADDIALPAGVPAGVSADEFEQAAREFESAYHRSPDRNDTLCWLAEKSVRDEKLTQAVACFGEIPTEHEIYGRSARHQQGAVLIRLHRAAEAERQLRTFIELEERSPQSSKEKLDDARHRLRFLLTVQLRNEERQAVLRDIVRSGGADASDLLEFCFPNLLVWMQIPAVQWVEKALRNGPDDVHLQIALGRFRIAQGRMDEARTILRECSRRNTDNLAAAAAELELMRQSGDWDSIVRRLSELPTESPTDPWLLLRIRGRAYNRQQQYDRALACFQWAAQADPANPETALGMAAAYAGKRQPARRKAMLARASTLGRIQNRLGWIRSRPEEITPYLEVARLCEQTDLLSPALLLVRQACRVDPKNEDARRLLERLEKRRSEVRGRKA